MFSLVPSDFLSLPIYFTPVITTPAITTFRDIRHVFGGPLEYFSIIFTPDITTYISRITWQGVFLFPLVFNMIFSTLLPKQLHSHFCVNILFGHMKKSFLICQLYIKYRVGKCRMSRKLCRISRSNSGYNDFRDIRHIFLGPFECRYIRSAL